MRVLLVSSSSGSLGGGEQYLVQLGAGLAQQGHSVETAMSDHARMDGLHHACSAFGKVARIPYRNTYDMVLRSAGSILARFTISRLAEFFASSDADVIHINKQNIEDGLDLLLAAKRAAKPTVVTIHIARSMTALNSRAGFLRDWLAARVLRQCPAHYITVAQHCSTQLLTGCRGVDPNQVHAVWNGVSLAPESDRESIRQEWSCEQGDVVLGCVARLEQQKDPLFALELLRQLPEHVKLVWVGDGRLRVEFEAATRKHGLESRVRLEGWRADARKRLAGFDIFVLPSVYEGFPFAVLEAMAAGLPCVASDVDGTREAVVTGETGFMCKRGDVGNWLDQLSPLIGDAAMRQHMGARGLERMREFFSLDAMARGTARVYAKAIGRAVGIPA